MTAAERKKIRRIASPAPAVSNISIYHSRNTESHREHIRQ
jgi:hypothetical protein